MTNLIKSINAALLDLVFPPKCPACEEILREEEKTRGFCIKCQKKIIHIGSRKNTCLKCGKRLEEEDREYCRLCEDAGHVFTQAKSIYEYSGVIKEAMYRFKYSNMRFYAETFARDGLRYYGRWLEMTNPRLILPVPMYLKKQRARGYNQAEVFGRYLSKKSGIPFGEGILLRTKNTKPLKTLSVFDRSRELADAFRCTKAFRRGVDVLLVDDIFTTGATVNAVSTVLCSAGVRHVYCMFVCNGRPV